MQSLVALKQLPFCLACDYAWQSFLSGQDCTYICSQLAEHLAVAEVIGELGQVSVSDHPAG